AASPCRGGAGVDRHARSAKPVAVAGRRRSGRARYRAGASRSPPLAGAVSFAAITTLFLAVRCAHSSTHRRTMKLRIPRRKRTRTWDEWMPALKLPLSLQQFLRLPRNSAYKYEYFGGQAYLTARPKMFHAVLDLAHAAPAAPPRGVALRPLIDADWK